MGDSNSKEEAIKQVVEDEKNKSGEENSLSTPEPNILGVRKLSSQSKVTDSGNSEIESLHDDLEKDLYDVNDSEPEIIELDTDCETDKEQDDEIKLEDVVQCGEGDTTEETEVPETVEPKPLTLLEILQAG